MESLEGIKIVETKESELEKASMAVTNSAEDYEDCRLTYKQQLEKLKEELNFEDCRKENQEEVKEEDYEDCRKIA